MSGPPDTIDIAPEHVRDRFSRLVALAIVLATFAGAMVGFLDARASRDAELANVDAQQLMVRALAGLVRADRAAQSDISTFALAELQRHGAANALQQRLLAAGADRRDLLLQERRYQELAERTQELTGLDPGGAAGPDQDPVFPARHLAESRYDPDRLWAMADAANEEDAAWEARDATYAGILAMFAVAVYLLGLALTLGVGVRHVLAIVGVALVLVGGVWASVIAWSPPHRAPDAAAAAFAEGRRALFVATSEADYREAAERYGEAIRLRPTFAQAYLERSVATFHAGSPQAGEVLSISRPQDLAASTADLQRALDLGLESAPLLGNLGFHAFLQGLEQDSPGLLEASVAYTRRALEIDPGDPLLGFNLGLGLLASGQAEEARQAYETATAGALEDGAGAGITGGAVTDLEILVTARPELAEEVADLKGLLAGSIAREEVVPPGRSVQTGPIELDVFPSVLQWRGDLGDYDLDRDAVSSYWYYRVETSLGPVWAVIPEASGVSFPLQDTSEGVRNLGHFDRNLFLTLTFPPRCLDDGSYRVEVYVNGHLAGEAEGEATFGGVEPWVARDVNVAMCRPADWEEAPTRLPGLLDGLVAPDGSAGTYVFRFGHPGTERDAETLSRSYLDDVVEAFGDLFPARPSFHSSPGGLFLHGEVEGPVITWYEYDGGQILSGAGVDEDGTVVVGVVFGPDEPAVIRDFDSMVELEQVG